MNTQERARLSELIEVVNSDWRRLVDSPITIANEGDKWIKSAMIKKKAIQSLGEAFINGGDTIVTCFFVDSLFFGDMEQRKVAYELFLRSLNFDNNCSEIVINAMSDFYLMDSSDPFVHKMIDQVRQDLWLCLDDVKKKLQLKDSNVICHA
jgi:hypothetical protein